MSSTSSPASPVVDMARSIKKGSVVVAVGTKKGGFLFHSPDRKKWSVAGPFMEGGAVYHMILDPRDGRTVYASAPMGSEPWGPAIYRGRAGEEPKATQASPKFKEGSDLSVSRVWHIEPGPSKTPDTIYAGVEPAALFRSDDRGDSWHDLDSLNYHPTRKEWQPGGGGLCLHSVLVDPRNARHLIVGISAVGAFETRDGGRSWTTENRGVRAGFLPNQYPEWGQCVHKLAWDASGDGSLFQQNHCGTYHRGPDGGAWTEVTKGLPSDFGFPIAAHPRRKHTAFVAPLVGAGNRVFPKGQMAVWKTTNSGKAWRSSTKGLPRPGRVPRGAPRGHGRRCRGSDRCLRRDEHGAALCEPRRRRIVEDDQRLFATHLLRDHGDCTVARTRRCAGERRTWKEAARPAPPGGRSRTQKTKIRTRTAASSCAIRQTVVVQESPDAAYAPRNSASVTKKPPMPRRIRAAMMIDVAPPPPPATARIEVATIPVRSASRPNTKTVMCWAGDRPMSQSLSPIPAIVPPHPKIVGEFARTSKRATNATIRRNNRTKTSRSSA